VKHALLGLLRLFYEFVMTVNPLRNLSAFSCAAAIIIGAILLHGCGGGGNAPQTYTIGGSVSGLTGTVVLQDNGGDNLTLTGNGPFTFATGITSGGDYKVSILSQPLGPTCAVTNGSGTAASNVTTVSVQCTLDPATFLLPLQATPVVPASTGKPGINGLVVLTSKALGDPPVQITGDNVLGLGYAQQLTVSSTGSISPGTITAIAYATSGVAGGDSFWTLNLSGSSSLKPVQMTNFVGAAQSYLNGMGLLAYKNLADPSSEFFVIGAASSNACGYGWMVLHASDTATTAPGMVAGLAQGQLVALYQPNGMLAGVVANDCSGNLNFYHDETFTNPVQLLQGAAIVELLAPPRQASVLTPISTQPTLAFLVLKVGAQTQLRRIDYTGSLSSDLYDFASTPQFAGPQAYEGFAADAANLYFFDLTPDVQGPAPSFVSFIEEPLDGSARATVLSTSNYYGSGTWGYVGSTGSQLVVDFFNGRAGGGYWSLPVASPGAGLTAIPTDGYLVSDLVGGDLLMSTDCSGRQICGGNTEIIATDGAVLSGPVADSYYTFTDNVLFQVQGANGNIYVVNQGNPLSPPAGPLAPKSGAANFGQGSSPDGGGFSGSPTIGIINISAATSTFIAAFDLSKNLITPITMDNTTFNELQPDLAVD